jgi:hypothetical protein
MMIAGQLVWLAHVLPAVALTITAPAPSAATSCGTENLIQEGSFAGVDLDDGVWNVVGREPGTVVDNYLFV